MPRMTDTAYSDDYRAGYIEATDHIFDRIAILLGERDKDYDKWQDYARKLEEAS